MDSNHDRNSTGEPGQWVVWDAIHACAYTAAERTPIADAAIKILAFQFAEDGHTERTIHAGGDALTEMTAVQARAVAAALIDTADQLDRLADQCRTPALTSPKPTA